MKSGVLSGECESGLESAECKGWSVRVLERWSDECRVGIGKSKVWSRVGSVNC
jgi:hypothetical protein